MSDLYYLVPGQDLDRQTSQYAIAYIKIDNLSNQWLFVPGSIQRYCPPLTLGWYAKVIPPANRFQVLSVPAPSGGVQSQPTGPNITIWTYDDDPQWVSQFSGSAGGTSVASSGVQTLRLTWTQDFTTWGIRNTPSTEVIRAAPGAGFRYRVYGASIRKRELIPVIIMAGVSVLLSSTVGGSGFLNLGMGGNEIADHESLGDIGFPMAANTDLVVTHRSDAISVVISVQISYTIEAS